MIANPFLIRDDHFEDIFNKHEYRGCAGTGEIVPVDCADATVADKNSVNIGNNVFFISRPLISARVEPMHHSPRLHADDRYTIA